MSEITQIVNELSDHYARAFNVSARDVVVELTDRDTVEVDSHVQMWTAGNKAQAISMYGIRLADAIPAMHVRLDMYC